MKSSASQRPNAPERSTSATSVSPAASAKSPARSQRQPSFFDAPSVAPRVPPTEIVNVPGECSGSQSFVRAHTRQVPAEGMRTVVRAASIGLSTPTASR